MARIYTTIPLRKLLLLGTLTAAIAAFYALGGDSYLSYQELKIHGAQLYGFVRSHPLQSAFAYVGIYLLAALLCLPGITLFLTMVGGGLFGFWMGTLMAIFSSTLGAFLAFLTIRYLFRNLARRQFQGRWEGVKERLKRHGVRYILMLRITTAFPYFLLNPLLALTPISNWTFLWTTALGIAPPTVFYAYLGHRVGLMRPDSTLKLLPVLVVLPLVIAVVVSPWLKRALGTTGNSG